MNLNSVLVTRKMTISLSWMGEKLVTRTHERSELGHTITSIDISEVEKRDLRIEVICQVPSWVVFHMGLIQLHFLTFTKRTEQLTECC